MSELKGISKYKEELIKNARYMVQKGKGILASDESTGTIGKRLATINVENTEENRRHYRELLYTCPELEKYISGAILYDETVYQKTKEGKRFTELLTSRGISVITICSLPVFLTNSDLARTITFPRPV